jgi:hypothetical protein
MFALAAVIGVISYTVFFTGLFGLLQTKILLLISGWAIVLLARWGWTRVKKFKFHQKFSFIEKSLIF